MDKLLFMKKQLLLLLLVVLASAVQAQKGSNAIKILGEAGIPQKDFNPGAGAQVKFLYGVCQSGQIGLTAGFTRFTAKETSVGGDFDPTRLTTIPVMLGYRHHVGRFYLEPQAGYGALNGRIDIGGDWARPSVGAFYWSVGAGFVHRRLEVGVRYLSAHGAEGMDAGTWHNKNFHFVGVHAGYTLWQKR
jgi:hypothetical protein